MLPYKIVRKETDMVMAHVLDNGSVEVHMPFVAEDWVADEVLTVIFLTLRSKSQCVRRLLKQKRVSIIRFVLCF